MGYRSEVAIKCQDKAFEMFKKTYSECGLMPDKIYEEDDCKIIYFSWIKWYHPEFDDIVAMEKTMDELDRLLNKEYYDDDAIYDQKLGYKFLRLGEDESDVEHRTNCYHIELWVKREIDLDNAKEITDYSLLS